MGPLKKYVRSKFQTFDPASPLLIAVCLLYIPQQTFILVSYSLALLRKSYVMFMNFRMKLQGVKREKRNKK